MSSRVTGLSLIGLLAISVPAPAAPILAEFSRTANSVADDGIGVPPAALQAVNNFDRIGLVETLLTDGSVAGGNYGQAFSHVAFGVLRIAAFAESRDGLQKSATASGGLQDVLTLTGAGTDGTTYHFSGSFLVTGTTSYLADTGLSVINVGYHWNAFQDAGATQVGGASSHFERNSAGVGFAGADFLGSAIPVEFDFVWGNQVILEMGLGAGVGANSVSSGSFAAASADLSHSLRWLGASIQTVGGAPIDASISGSSGTNWAQAAAVPEPATLTLLGLGLGVLAKLRLKPSRTPR